MQTKTSHRDLIAAGTALGIGMGGFADGIVFHQLLQIHNMLSAKYPTRGVPAETLVVNLEVNMFWDGLFHVFTWLMTAIGISLLWHAVRRPGADLSTPILAGAILIGWGLFNLVEGVVNHHLLHIHHVLETKEHLVWDLIFLASGAVLITGGWLMIRSHARHGDPKAKNELTQ